MNWRKFSLWAIAIAAAITVIVGIALWTNRWRPRTVSIQGAVIRRDQDTRKELPISDVVVTASDGVVSSSTQSDASGYFNLKFKANIWPAKKLTVSFRSQGYEPLDLELPIGLRLTTKK